jgi:hypothetical protein
VAGAATEPEAGAHTSAAPPAGAATEPEAGAQTSAAPPAGAATEPEAGAQTSAAPSAGAATEPEAAAHTSAAPSAGAAAEPEAGAQTSAAPSAGAATEPARETAKTGLRLRGPVLDDRCGADRANSARLAAISSASYTWLYRNALSLRGAAMVWYALDPNVTGSGRVHGRVVTNAACLRGSCNRWVGTRP